MGVAGLVASLLAISPAHAQDIPVRELPAPAVDLGWSDSVSDVPLADLSGLWKFVEATSDPMVEVWRGRVVVYQISQQSDRIVMSFEPENGEPSVQEYRWDGSVNAFERGGAQVRERARWRNNGRALEIEGRWWPADDRSEVFRYTFVYTIDSNRRLLFRQIDEYGETAWHFSR
jgi:hypothetical protein